MPSIFDYEFKFHKKGDHQVDFQPSDEDTTTAVQYFGFLSNSGAWYIAQYNTTTPVATYRYIFGTSDYATNWTARAGLTYKHYNELF